MKIIIAAVASIAFATSAVAAVPSTKAAKLPTIKTVGQIELALGSSRGLAASTRQSNTNSKGGASTGGKTTYAR